MPKVKKLRKGGLAATQGQNDIPKPYFAKPRLLRNPTIKSYTLLTKTWLSRRQKSKRCALRRVKQIRPPSGKQDWNAYRAIIWSKDGRHNHVVNMLFAGPVDKDTPVVIGCDCADFVYTFETVLAKRGASTLYRSNGDDPGIRNPGNRLGLCGHAYSALKYMIARTPKKETANTQEE